MERVQLYFSEMSQIVGSDGYASKYPVNQLLFRQEMLSSDDDIDMTLIYKGQGDDEHLHEVINN